MEPSYIKYICFGSIIIIALAMAIIPQIVIRKRNERMKSIKNKYKLRLHTEGFRAEKSISFASQSTVMQVLFDFKKKQIAILDLLNEYWDLIEIDSIIGCELLQDNSTVMTGGVGRAIVGGALAGGFGAMVGASTRSSSDIVRSLAVRIITNDPIKAMVMIEILNGELNRKMPDYKELYGKAQDIYSTVISVMDQNKQENKIFSNEHDEVIEKIRKFAKLKDDGLITEEEYERKRKKLLGLVN